jgi:hypothetical protein
MLQVFHPDVAYIAMAIHVCCKCIVPNVLAVSDVRCKCFIWLLHMFHTYVVSVLSRYCICFTHMLQVCYLDGACVSHIFCKCFIWICIYLTHMLQVLHLNVSYVLQWLHMFFWYFRRMLQVFQQFRTYVAIVLSRCYKSRPSVAHVVVGPICRSSLLQPLGPRACTWGWRGREQQVQ